MAAKENEILITGFGGQGIIMIGSIMGKAAAIYDGKHSTMTQAYGPEARGGSCSAQVIVSDEEISFPQVEQPELMVCMSQEGFTKNIGMLQKGGVLVWDTDLVKAEDLDPSWTTFNVPATRFAEELGNKMMANIVMVGFVSAVSNVISAESLKQSVLSSVPGPTRDKNAEAFERGRTYGLEILKGRAKQEKGRV